MSGPVSATAISSLIDHNRCALNDLLRLSNNIDDLVVVRFRSKVEITKVGVKATAAPLAHGRHRQFVIIYFLVFVHLIDSIF